MTSALDLSFYLFGDKHWGFKFQMPKFQGYDELYLRCSTYVCDKNLDPKPYCDRSCFRNPKETNNNRQRRSASIMNDEVSVGPFKVRDDGFGPLIRLQTEVKAGTLPGISLSQIYDPNELLSNL